MCIWRVHNNGSAPPSPSSRSTCGGTSAKHPWQAGRKAGLTQPRPHMLLVLKRLNFLTNWSRRSVGTVLSSTTLGFPP